MAKIARQGCFLAFNEQTSCLKPMVDALKADIAPGILAKEKFILIRRTLEKNHPNHSKRYQEALNYVEISWPNWIGLSKGIKVLGTAPVTNVLRHVPVTPTPVVVPSAPATMKGIAIQGWEYANFNPAVQNWTTAVSLAEALPPLKKTEISRINEALKRAKLAVEMARDVLIKMEKLNWNALLNPDQNLYVYYFGDYDKGRFTYVLNNFKVLALAFQKGPKIIDLRNTLYGKTCYAACYRHDLRTFSYGSLTLTGKVDMYLGRDFLKVTSSYVSSTDNTVGTLVHEFSHGAINAVDAPPVKNGSWKRNPAHAKLPDRKTPDSDPPHPDFGESPVNSIQASTDAADHDLADFAPDIAIRNADNYGQFARSMLIRKSK